VDTFTLAVAAVVLVAAAAYAQIGVARFTAGSGKAALARSVLFVVGVAFGYVATTRFADLGRIDQLLVFASAFGLVHAPAAIILFLKKQSAAGKS
jgi:hypothetical protein